MTRETHDVHAIAARMFEDLREAHRMLENFKSGQYLNRAESQPGPAESVAPGPASPLRVVHQFACTGGTLICKCIASMPNVQLLSEVDPLDAQAHANPTRFVPTDLVRLLRLATQPVKDKALIDVFMAGLEEIGGHADRMGLRLVLRDHSHGHFCFGRIEPARPTLRELLAPFHDLKSVVWVRHPVASFTSLQKNGWLHFEPRTIDEYAKRYLAFLSRYEDVPVYRYEAFVESPSSQMKEICRVLDLPYRAGFEETFGAHRLSGDSGRSGGEIAPREGRTIPNEVLKQVHSSEAMGELCNRLGYSDADPSSFCLIGLEHRE